MKIETFEKRTSEITKTSNGYIYAKALLQNPALRIYTCHTTGYRRFKRNLDYTGQTIAVLKKAGLTENVDFVIGNDAPRGGLTGNYIYLTSRGRKKCIK